MESISHLSAKVEQRSATTFGSNVLQQPLVVMSTKIGNNQNGAAHISWRSCMSQGVTTHPIRCGSIVEEKPFNNT